MGGDQTFFWMNAQRMLYGEQAYKDFFQFTPPGADVFYFCLFKMLGPRVWVTNGAVLALGVALCYVCFNLAGKIMDRGLGLLASFLFLVLVYGRQPNGTHHWFSVLAVMCAVAINWEQRNKAGTLFAGALLGLASFFTQTRGVMAVLAFLTFFIWKRFRTGSPLRDLLWNQFVLVFGFAAMLLIMSAHFIATAGLKRLWYFQVTYVGRYMVHGLQIHELGLPAPIAVGTLPQLAPYLAVYVLLPAIYAIVLTKCWQDRADPSPHREQVELLAILGSFLLVEVALSINWLRLFSVSMPGFILLGWIVGQTDKGRRNLIVIMWLFLCILGVREIWSQQYHAPKIAVLPGGRIATSPQTYEKLEWVRQHTTPSQFFFQAAWPGVYLPLQLRNPAFADAVETNRQTRPEFIEMTVRQLEARRVQFVQWSVRLDHADDQATREAIAPLRGYLQDRYLPVHTFSDQDVIWERK
jgi:hypothetical protein